MRLVHTLLVIRYALYSAMLIAGGLWFLYATPFGIMLVQRGLNFAGVFVRDAPDATIQRLAEDERFRVYLDQAQQAASMTGDSVGVFADQASAVAYASAAAIPDPDDLAAALEGWQTDLLDYEAQLRAELGAGASEADVERMMDDLFRPQTFAGRIDAPAPPPPVAPPVETPVPEPARPEQPAAEPAPAPEAPVVEEPAQPASAAPTPIVVAFQPHPAFYRCPVIEVSNAGPTADDRTLTEYTPWIDTPAGVLIRAPVAGACLSSGYGPRTVEGASKNHGGVDFHNRDGGAIFAAGDGVVLEAGEDEAYGHAVRIDHGNGVEGHYAHMVAGSLKVRAGDRVTLGDEIGVMGRTGRAYAVHLHYELRFSGETVDPLYEGKRAAF